MISNDFACFQLYNLLVFALSNIIINGEVFLTLSQINQAKEKDRLSHNSLQVITVTDKTKTSQVYFQCGKKY